LFVLAFFKGKSERADILDLGVSNDGLSFEIVKSKIKNLAAVSLVGLLADPLLSFLYCQLYMNQQMCQYQLMNCNEL
jgi:hypothetical protein